ncbi:flagellar hook capping FlgD N-terminal domain-containing protein [Jannaschia sp. M317]|uniref:flagellar hook capping FlgD N-terminal domain-containing protein n=1 Tax=Jannaschia sp. M317 TaxID=2867011 RepID=UPI0021A8A21A|nr:flagellar hook capping FlgD N-terminal domain-containing protein [Jannaschia sp. M317]UWQ17735.1 flagellar hook assembly protein FlgD [Jannaschia sp. M317]
MNAINATSSASAASQTETGARKALSSDLDTFLKLLTAQIRNQDPLEPTDGTEYAAQLAQFSGVEQAVRTNELLADMGAKLARQDMAVAAGWIGMEVRHQGPLLLSHDGVQMLPDIPVAADRAEMVVTDSKGDEVLRVPVDRTADRIDWAGDDGRGGQLPEGIYDVQIAAYAGEQELGQRPVSHYAPVEEVTLGTGGADLLLPGGIRIGIGETTAVRPAA